jgi:tetratricopeptide (TPR) repeat protein
MADPEKELADIRREVIESRNLVIRTDNQLKTLHAEVKALGRKVDEASQRQRFASAAAYALFALLAVGAGVAVSSVRAAVGASERERLSKQVAESKEALTGLQASMAAASSASAAATQALRMLDEGPPGDRPKAVAALARVDQAHLTPLERSALRDRLEGVRHEVGSAAIAHGQKAIRQGDPQSAVEELTAFLALDPPEPDSLEAAFLLGTALAKSGKPAEAVPLLSRVVERDKRVRYREEAMALLALAYEQRGQAQKAAEVARAALDAAPGSPWAPAFRSRIAAARRATAADAGPAAAADGGTAR